MFGWKYVSCPHDVPAAQVGDGPGQQVQAVEGSAVVRQRHALVGAALDVLPGRRLDVVAGVALVVGGAADVSGNARQGRAHGLAQGVERAAHACDHMRSRLW